MHEYSLVQALVARVEQEAQARGAIAVRRVHVRIGELAGVDPELFATAYDMFRGEEGPCRDAALEVEHVPARWACGACGRAVVDSDELRCPGCGGPARLEAGDEILLARIEMEVP